MKQYLRMALLAGALTGALSTNPAYGVNLMEGGGSCYRTPRGACIDYHLLDPPDKNGTQISRVVVQHQWSADVYSVKTRPGDDIQSVFADLLRVLPQASMDRFLRENNFEGNQMSRMVPSSLTSSLTYTVQVQPGSPVHQ